MLLNNGEGKYLYFVNLADMSGEQSLLLSHHQIPISNHQVEQIG
jgi:hypothetical protein